MITGRIAVAHGRNGIRQVAPDWGSRGHPDLFEFLAALDKYYWRRPRAYPKQHCNETALNSQLLPWAHSSPNPKGHLDWFSRFCTIHGRAVLYSGSPSPEDCLFPLVYLMHDSLGPSKPKTQTASRLFQPFCTAHRTVSLYFTMDRPILLKIARSVGI